MEEIKTDLLIIGTGPAGASLACFFASHGTSVVHRFFPQLRKLTLAGLTGIMLGEHSGSIDTPRAHITNMAALGKTTPDYTATCRSSFLLTELHRMLARHRVGRSMRRGSHERRLHAAYAMVLQHDWRRVGSNLLLGKRPCTSGMHVIWPMRIYPRTNHPMPCRRVTMKPQVRAATSTYRKRFWNPSSCDMRSVAASPAGSIPSSCRSYGTTTLASSAARSEIDLQAQLMSFVPSICLAAMARGARS